MLYIGILNNTPRFYNHILDADSTCLTTIDASSLVSQSTDAMGSYPAISKQALLPKVVSFQKLESLGRKHL